MLTGKGKVMRSGPIDPVLPLGTVEMGGTSAVVVASTRGMALATLIAPAAIMPTPSTVTAERAIHCGTGDM